MSETTAKKAPDAINIDRSAGDFSVAEEYAFDAGLGLSERVIDYISDAKNEPDWIRAFRKKALEIFYKKPLPTHWAPEWIKDVDFDKIRYYLAKNISELITVKQVLLYPRDYLGYKR